MRILMFTGKGGVGKTSLAAATGVKLATLNYRTLVTQVFEFQLSDVLRKKAAGKYYLEQSYQEHAPWLVRIQSNPNYDFLHSDPRYQAIVKKMGLPPAS